MNKPDGAKRASRRALLIGGGLVAAGAAALALRKRDLGAPHDEYFAGLSRALADAGLARPTLVVDRARMMANVNGKTRP